jgi:hypothetical protein
MKMSSSSLMSWGVMSLLLACGGGESPLADDETSRSRPSENGAALCYTVCGDHICDTTVESYSCPQDCGDETVCGDRRCCNESPFLCPQDCPYADDFCYFTPPY